MHMYQLNSYNKIEQKNWMKENAYPLLGRHFGVWVSIVFFKTLAIISINFSIIFAIILNLATFWGNKPGKSKVPLKYTNRVKRMLFTSTLLYLIILITGIWLFYANKIFDFVIIPTQLLCISIPYLIMFSNFLNTPLEKHINQKFINEAKDKLESMTNLTIIGITGSYGKTSVKHILGKLLGKDYNVLITPGNYNTTLGVVITIRQYLSPIHEIFICEMGAKGVGEIKEICDIVHPHHAVITSIGEQHLETFLSVENIIKTKFELADAINSEEGTVFLNYDNEYIRNHKTNKNIISYAIDNQADYMPYDIRLDEQGCTFMLNMKGEDKPVKFTTNLIGKHNVLNIAGCIAVAHKLNVSVNTLVQRVKQLEQVEHRQQIIKKDFGIIIDDAYNSNPSGAKSALDTLSMFDMTKIVITPGMVELGDRQYELNKEFGKQITKVADYIILVGKNQTKPIQDGIKEQNYDENRIFIIEDMNKAIVASYNIKCDNKKAILIENDLPDNY